MVKLLKILYKDLLVAMGNFDFIPSEYILENMEWFFDKAISNRSKEVILYFADRLREYPPIILSAIRK
jgi:hypothetical protein